MHTCTYSRKPLLNFPRETSDVWPPEREEPVEKLLGEMEKNQIDQAVLVQMAGTSLEQHRYLLKCLKEDPNGSAELDLFRKDIRILPNTWRN